MDKNSLLGQSEFKFRKNGKKDLELEESYDRSRYKTVLESFP
jgi:hypothetical protein